MVATTSRSSERKKIAPSGRLRWRELAPKTAKSRGRHHGREFWGQGIATRALEKLLTQVPIRSLHARVALANGASLRVLQKCGFTIVRYQKSPADDRFAECEETILELTQDGRDVTVILP
jgi:RimJ/RimL family protein N-acetyltransferase